MTQVIAITNQKGGVGKTATAGSLSTALATLGKRVLLIDFDPQGNLTKGLGCRQHDFSINDLLLDEISEIKAPVQKYVMHTESVDLIPADLQLAGLDIRLSAAMSRETILTRALERFKPHYDYIIIDSNPALNLFTINTLVASNSVIIPVQAEPYATDGLSDLLSTIGTIKKQLNPKLKIKGILLTMTDNRNNLSKHITKQIRNGFKGKIKVFDTVIPRCIKTAEATLYEKSLLTYAPNSESAKAYKNLAKEILEK
ncbi:MAG: ParA family protein [Candidatus Fimenecus sp.]